MNDHEVRHSHDHAHRVGHPDAIGHTILVYHDHEHAHTSLRESFAIERSPIHRRHFHTTQNEPKRSR